MLPDITQESLSQTERKYHGQSNAVFIKNIRARFRTSNPLLVCFIEHRAKSLVKEMVGDDKRVREKMFNAFAAELYFAFCVAEDAIKLAPRNKPTGEYAEDDPPVSGNIVVASGDEMREFIEKLRLPKKR